MEVHQLPICFVKDRQESILMIIDDSLFIMRLEDDVDRQKADFRNYSTRHWAIPVFERVMIYALLRKKETSVYLIPLF